MYLSAGHSTVDPGAAGNGLTEADIVADFRNMLAFYLRRAKVAHEVDASGTGNLPLAAAIKRAKFHSVAVEFHCNASDNPTATGVETLSQPKDLKLGNAICKAIAETIGIRNRGAKPEASGQHSRLGFVQAGGIIVELFFITNASDVKAYQERKWLVAKAVAEVLIANASSSR